MGDSIESREGLESPDSPLARVAELADLIRSSRHCVAFTGAGVSTLSGIPDFRGKGGLYTTGDADRMFDLEVFMRDPSVYYAAARELVYGLEGREPSIVHRSLASLERRGLVKAVITQNIDLLHRKAGSARVLEIHGSPATHRCVRCGKAVPFAEVIPVARSGAVPRCAACSGALKPDIVFYGQALPEREIEEALAEARKADLMLVLGTSLTVNPAASIPELAARSGAALVIVNDGATALDSLARLRFRDLGSTFELLMGALSR